MVMHTIIVLEMAGLHSSFAENCVTPKSIWEASLFVSHSFKWNWYSVNKSNYFSLWASHEKYSSLEQPLQFYKYFRFCHKEFFKAFQNRDIIQLIFSLLFQVKLTLYTPHPSEFMVVQNIITTNSSWKDYLH